jgi:hypothetical protein
MNKPCGKHSQNIAGYGKKNAKRNVQLSRHNCQRTLASLLASKILVHTYPLPRYQTRQTILMRLWCYIAGSES